MKSFYRYLRLVAEPVQELETWQSIVGLISVAVVGVAAFLGFGILGSAVVVALIVSILSIVAGVRLQAVLDETQGVDLEFEQLAAVEQPFELPAHSGHKVFLVKFLIRNQGQTSDFVALLVSKSVQGISEEYPQGSANLRWQTPNRVEHQRVGRGLDARVDVAWVLPTAGAVYFLGPGDLHWKLVRPSEEEEVVGLIDVADVTRDVEPLRLRFTMVTGLSHPVALSVTPV